MGDWFYFYDAYTSTNATVIDLLAHKMGTPTYQEMGNYAAWTMQELAE